MSDRADDVTSADADTWFLDPDRVTATLREAKRAAEPMPSIAGYALIAEVARGGQGVVYVATQLGTKRAVAIKVLLDPSFADAARRQRFEREAEIVASLDHPGIVRVFGAGATSNGQPFLAMEYVDGVTFDAHVDGMDRDPARVVALVVEVLDALHAAHLKGVIHRDVKSSNVLVGRDGRPRLVDFGLARTMRTPGAGGLDLSVAGQFLGSLAWASPEQAAGLPERIDVRTDVYSAGILLFRCLTGRFPYDVDGTLADVLHAIATREPLRASALRRGIPRNLDAILAVALEKDPARRYQSAAEFAADLRAHLAGDPIVARRDGALASMARRLRRSRRVAIAALGVAAVLLATALLAWRSAREASAARDVAERRLAQVRSIAGDFMFSLHEDLVKLAGSRPARERLVTRARDYLREIERDASGASEDPVFLAELSAAWERVGDIQGNPLLPNLGEPAEAIASYREAIALRERAKARGASIDETSLATSRLYDDIGIVELRRGDAAASIAALTESKAHLDAMPAGGARERERLSAAMTNRDRLADTLTTLQRHDEALEALREAQTIGARLEPGDEDRARALGNLAILHGKIAFAILDRGSPTDALPDAIEAARLSREAAALAPGDARYRRALSIALNDLGDARTRAGQREPARAALEESVGIVRALVAADANDAQAQDDLAYTLVKLGTLLASDPTTVEGSVAPLSEAVDVRAALLRRNPSDAFARRGEIVAIYTLADAHERAGRALDASSEERKRTRDAHWRDAEALYAAALARVESMQADGVLLERDRGLVELFRGYVERVRGLRAGT